MEATATRSDTQEVDKPRGTVNKDRALKLHSHGVPGTLIAEIEGCHRSYIHKLVKPVKEKQQELREYESVQADVFLDTQAKLLSMVDTLLTKGDSPSLGRIQQLVISACALKDKERLERGKATSHVSIHTYSSELDKITELRQELDALRHAVSHDNTDQGSKE